MDIKLIKSEEEYKIAVARLEVIGEDSNFENDQTLIDEFDLLATLIDLYEKEHYPFDAGHPIDIIKMKMKYLDLAQKDLIPYIGSKGIVSEVMNKKRSLSKAMIRNLSKFLKIEQDILNVEYKLSMDDKLEKPLSSANPTENLWDQFGFDQQTQKNIRKYANHTRKRGLLMSLCSN